VVFHAYATISYVISLQGVEGMLLDLEALNRHWGSGKAASQPYTVIPLKGKFKVESHHFCHLIPCVAVTSSGVKVEKTLNRLRRLKRQLGFVDGPAISTMLGRALTSRSLDDTFLELLEELFETA
jgi:hypothetical protein